jgi:long-chain fatty acid transport protein
MSKSRYAVIGFIGGASLAAATEAVASGFAIRENSAAGLGTAFAGAGSAATDLSTVFSNPAGMTHFSGQAGEVVASYILPHSKFTGSAATTTGVTVAGDNNQDGGMPAAVPAMYGLVSLSQDLKLGIAITSPFDLGTRYREGWIGRYNAINSEIHTVDINPNVAYRVSDWLSLGGGFSAQHIDARLSNSIFLAPFPDGHGENKASDWGYGFNFGALVEPSKDTRVGLSYRSQIYHKLQGNVVFNVPAPLAASFPNGPIQGQLRTPDNVTLSATHDYSSKLSVSADIQWTHWSTFNSLAIVRSNTGQVIGFTQENWTNSWFGALGATYRPTDQLTLRSGVAFDQSPVEDAFRTARIPDQDRYWIAAGIGYQVTPGLSVDAGYAHIFLPDASLRSNFSVPLTAGASGTLTGNYDNHIDIFTVSAKMSF